MQARQDMQNINYKFRLAAAKGELHSCQTLAKNVQLDVNEQGQPSGKTALHQAIINSQIAVIRFLLTLNVTHIPDAEGKTPMDYARENDLHAVIMLLIQKFPSLIPAIPSSDLIHTLGNTLFNHISQNARTLTPSQCLEYSKQFPPGSYYMGSSFLILLALKSYNWDAMKALLEHGEDPNIQMAEYQFATYRDTVLHMFMANEDTNYLEFLDLVTSAGKKIDYTVRDEQGKTTLLLAAKIRRPIFVRELLGRGAHSAIAIPDNEGNNILHVACILGDLETLKLFEQHELFETLLNQKNMKGKTPADCLNLSEKETITFIKSIFINPNRDINAPKNAAQPSTFKPANISFLQTCLDGRKLIEQHLKELNEVTYSSGIFNL